MVLGYAFFLYNDVTPWFAIAFAGFLAGLTVPQPAWRSGLAGFAAVFLLWWWLQYRVDTVNEGILSARISAVMGLSKPVIMLLGSVIGGLVAGMAALTGAFLRKK